MIDQLQPYINIGAGSVLAFVGTWFWWSKNQALERGRVADIEHQRVLDRLAELEVNMKLNAQTITPIVTAFQAILVKQLTHPDKHEMDALLVKVGPPHILTPEESARLATMLQERSVDYGNEITLSDRESAIILPIVMKMAHEEQVNIAAAGAEQDRDGLKLITVVSVITDGKLAVDKNMPTDE